MEDLIGIVKNEMMLQEKQRGKFVLSLRKIPRGNLVKKGDYYYEREYSQGSCKEIYLGKDDVKRVQGIKTSKYIENAIKTIDNNRKVMERFLNEYKNFDPISLCGSIGKAYETPSEKAFSICGIDNYNNWGVEEYQASDRWMENLTMTAIKGHKVRSKSELIIANQLFLNDVKYKYECECCFQNYKFYPDFIILQPKTFEIFFWEHFGLINDPKYLDSALEKLKKYISNGITPWKNLIITFDDEHGNLDSKIIANIINTYFPS